MDNQQMNQAVEVIETEAKIALKNPLLPTGTKKSLVLMAGVLSELVERQQAQAERVEKIACSLYGGAVGAKKKVPQVITDSQLEDFEERLGIHPVDAQRIRENINIMEPTHAES